MKAEDQARQALGYPPRPADEPVPLHRAHMLLTVPDTGIPDSIKRAVEAAAREHYGEAMEGWRWNLYIWTQDKRGEGEGRNQ